MTPFFPPRRITTGPQAAPFVSCVTVIPLVLCPESVTLRMASVRASLESLGVSVIAVTTPLLRSPPMAVKVGLLGHIGSSPYAKSYVPEVRNELAMGRGWGRKAAGPGQNCL